MTHFTIVPPRRSPRPIPLYRFANNTICKVHCIAAAALTIETPPGEPTIPILIYDYAMKGLIFALRDAADRIEQKMADRRAQERRAEEARRHDPRP